MDQACGGSVGGELGEHVAVMFLSWLLTVIAVLNRWACWRPELMFCGGRKHMYALVMYTVGVSPFLSFSLEVSYTVSACQTNSATRVTGSSSSINMLSLLR